MVKKKKRTIKKKSRRSPLKKVNEKFANYEEKIDRLNSLKEELKILDTRGFKTEVNLIKSKLKDPTAIPEIEKRMGDLKRKMLKKPKKKSSIKKIQEAINEIRNKDMPELFRQIKKLTEILKTKRKIKRRKKRNIFR